MEAWKKTGVRVDLVATEKKLVSIQGNPLNMEGAIQIDIVLEKVFFNGIDFHTVTDRFTCWDF